MHASTHNLEHCACAHCVFFNSNRQGLQTYSDSKRISYPKGRQLRRHRHLPVPGLQQAWNHPHQHQRLCHWWMFVLYMSLIQQSFVCVCASVCVSHFSLCVSFQSLLLRSLLRMGMHTHLQRARRLYWSVRPLALLNLKSYGEAHDHLIQSHCVLLHCIGLDCVF